MEKTHKLLLVSIVLIIFVGLSALSTYIAYNKGIDSERDSNAEIIWKSLIPNKEGGRFYYEGYITIDTDGKTIWFNFEDLSGR